MRLGDSLRYREWALEISGGDWLGSEVFYQAPLYPYLLAVLYSLFGSERIVILLLQAILGAVSCALICDATIRLHSRKAGITAGLALACYAPSIFFDGLIQKTATDQILLCAVINLVVRWQQKTRLQTCLLLGLAAGLLILSRENALVFPIVIVVGMFVTKRPLYHEFIRSALVFVVGLAAVLLPVAVRNYSVGGEFHLTTSQFGPNFFIGNNLHANGTYQPLLEGGGNAQAERRDATMLAEKALGKSLTPGEVSHYWSERTLKEIQSDPVRWLNLMCRKLAYFCNRVEVTDTEDIYSYSEYSAPLRLLNPIANFGTLGPLAVLGLLLSRRNWRELSVLVGMLLAYTASVLLFYVFGRYRFPVVPILCVFAGMGIADGIRIVSLRFRGSASATEHSSSVTRAELVPILFIAAGAFLFCNWPFLNAEHMKSISQYNMAVEFDRSGRNRLAIDFYLRALELVPGDANAHANLASVLARTGRLEGAAHHYREAIHADVPSPGAHFALANVYAQMGMPVEAAENYRKAILDLPDLVPAHLNLGVALLQQGRADAAVDALERAASLAPDYPAAHLNLAHALADIQRFEDAKVHYQTVLELDPGNSLAETCLRRVTDAIQKHDSKK
ncbi:tetratricopeptide repeat protein [Fuerstiella marisgermanici]